MSHMSEKGREAAALKAEKRAAALRENLKRRKEAKEPNKGDKNAEPENRE
jgi:hypothetical protein